jgi:hypothetical protein
MITVILPFTRPIGAAKCMDAIYRNSGDVVYELLAEEDKKRIGTNPMVNNLVRKSKFDIICFMHDDSVPRKDFLVNAYNTMGEFADGYGCVGFNDLIHDEDGPSTHWLIHKKMLRYFPDGVFYSEDYIHTRCDLELKEVCKAVGRYQWDENAKVKHVTPFYYALQLDELSKTCYSPEALKHDKKTYLRRRAEQGANWSTKQLKGQKKQRDPTEGE